ncbi:MAG: Ig-like domain-containing protein [Actinobacteria bacterium]|nr:Ig-like domain-containing protein [Actinomycetota bacterium]
MRKGILVLVTVLILVAGLGIGFYLGNLVLGGGSKPATEPPKEPEAATTTAPVEKAPQGPAAVEKVFPAPDQEGVKVGEPIAITFRGEVDQKAIEEAFRVWPAVKGSFSWDGQTLVFKPDAPLGAGRLYRVSLGDSDQTRPLTGTKAWTFLTEGGKGRILALENYGAGDSVVALEPEAKVKTKLGGLPNDKSFNDARWSADGKQLVFQSGFLNVISAEGKNLKEVFRFEGPAEDNNPALDPDGSTVAFLHDGQIWSVPAQGGDPRRLTKDAGRKSAPAWSPDGKFVAYLAGDGEPKSLWIVREDGKEPRQLSAVATGAFAWAPGSDRIAFQAKKGITVVSLDKARETLIAEEVFGDPAWSPDGSRILVLVKKGDGKTGTIRVMNSDGSAGIEVARDARSPAWSPTGSHVAYVDSSGKLFTVRADGKSRVQVTAGSEKYYLPKWVAR